MLIVEVRTGVERLAKVRIVNKGETYEAGVWNYTYACDDPDVLGTITHRRSDGWARLVEIVMDRIAEAGS